MLLATTFLTFLWSLIVIFFMVIFFILLFHVIVDLFSRHDASGWKKAAWVFFLIVFPFLGLFVYYITNADGMAQRQVKQVQQAQADADSYIRDRGRGRRSRVADREGEAAPRRRHDLAGRVRPAQGEGARRVARVGSGRSGQRWLDLSPVLRVGRGSPPWRATSVLARARPRRASSSGPPAFATQRRARSRQASRPSPRPPAQAARPDPSLDDVAPPLEQENVAPDPMELPEPLRLPTISNPTRRGKRRSSRSSGKTPVWIVQMPAASVEATSASSSSRPTPGRERLRRRRRCSRRRRRRRSGPRPDSTATQPTTSPSRSATNRCSDEVSRHPSAPARYARSRRSRYRWRSPRRRSARPPASAPAGAP